MFPADLPALPPSDDAAGAAATARPAIVADAPARLLPLAVLEAGALLTRAQRHHAMWRAALEEGYEAQADWHRDDLLRVIARLDALPGWRLPPGGGA